MDVSVCFLVLTQFLFRSPLPFLIQSRLLISHMHVNEQNNKLQKHPTSSFLFSLKLNRLIYACHDNDIDTIYPTTTNGCLFTEYPASLKEEMRHVMTIKIKNQYLCNKNKEMFKERML